MKRLFTLALIPFFFYSCEPTDLEPELTDDEIVEGLKEALRVGTDTSVATTSKEDGYYRDSLIKILLPEEAEKMYDGIEIIRNTPLLGPVLASELDTLMEDVIMGINRSAEDAAKEAAPIFWDAIVGMTIADGIDILYGEDTAATSYLKVNTYDTLVETYKPKMQASLNKPLVLGVSAQDTWTTLTTKYNNAANSLAGQVAGIQPVNTELDDFVTRKGLNGLFLKVADEEKRIRENPLARVTEILEKVFSVLD